MTIITVVLVITKMIIVDVALPEISEGSEGMGRTSDVTGKRTAAATGAGTPLICIPRTIPFTPVHLHLCSLHRHPRGAIRCIFDIGTQALKNILSFISG